MDYLKSAMGKLDTIINKIIKGGTELNLKIIKRDSKHYLIADHDPIPTLNPQDKHKIHQMVKCCREEIQNSEDSGIMPAPKYFEQVAILSRMDKRYDNEIAICEMYIELLSQYAARNNLTEAEVSTQLAPVCVPLLKRIHNAKIMVRHSTK